METTDRRQWITDVGNGYSRMRPLDEGGMGTLYLAHKDSLDIDVVIKRVKQKFRGRMDERAEANILKNLKHKYLPRIYDIINSPSGYVYTIMDYIQGENMQKYIEKNGPANQKTVYRWACQLCEAVAYLHTQTPPILHCDIKPSNVMITPSGDICVIDFNTSLVFSKGVLALGATPGYAAPEQYAKGPTKSDEEATLPLFGRAEEDSQRSCFESNYSATAAQATNAGDYGTISKRTDVYGIGATLYFAATGQRPAHALEQVRPITSYHCGLSKSFQAIILRAMRKHQEERFQDAQEMLRALQDIHLMDRRYQNTATAQKMVALVSVLMMAAGAACVAFGVQRMGQERVMLYDSLVRSGRTAGEAMQFDTADQALQRAISLYDDRLEAYVEQAVLLYRQGEYQECVDEIGSILTRPLQYRDVQTVANLYYTAARSYDALEEYENAVRMYQKSLEYAPEQAIEYQGLAAAQLQLGDLSGAEETLQLMRQEIPEAEDTAAYQVALGTLQYRRGGLEDALASAQAAINASGDEEQKAQAYLLAANIYEEMGEAFLSEEIDWLETGISQLPAAYYNVMAEPLAAAYVRLSAAEGTSEGLSRALEVYQQMQTNGNRTFEIRLSTAIVQYRLEDFAGAEQTLLSLQEEYPDDYRVYKWLAFVADAEQNQAGTYDFSEAKDYWLQAKQLYEIAQTQGTSDPEMDELDQIAFKWV